LNVTVKLFANFRNGRFVVEPRVLQDGATIESVITALAIPLKEVGVIMVNGRHASPESALREGDVLAIFPLVGGG
jgi:molybdopterin converting factor small subunit